MFIRRFPRIQSSAFLALLLLVGACAHAPQTHHHAVEPVEVKRLFVLTGLGSEDNNVYAASFARAISEGIGACNIEVKVENVPVKDRSLSLDADPFVAVNKEVKLFAPDTMIRVGQKESTKLSGMIGGVGINVILIKLDRPVAQGGPMVWNGTFTAGSALDAAEGAALARSILDKMKQDNVVKGCPVSK